MSTGKVMEWLNRDDLHNSGALHQVADIFSQNNYVNLARGGIRYINSTSQVLANHPCGTGIKPNMLIMLGRHCHVDQASVFWSSNVWQISIFRFCQDQKTSKWYDYVIESEKITDEYKQLPE